MIDSKTSKINILVALNKATLQQVIDTQLPVDLLQQFSPGGDKSLRINVRRKGNLDFQVDRNTFKYEVPLELFVQKDTMLGNVDVLFEMYLGFETKFLFKENWELATRTQLTGYQWVKKPKLDLGFFDFPLEGTVTKAINGNKETICKQIDAKIKEVADIRPKLNQLLSSLPNPIPTPQQGQVWWQCETVETAMTPLYENEGFIYGKINITGATEFSFGKELERLTTIVKSPNIVTDVEKESHIRTQINLGYRALEKSAIALLQKQTFEFKGKNVKIDNVKISQAQHRIKVVVDLSDSFNGTATLIGKPIFDNSKQEIKLTEVDLDLKGNNFISKTLVVFLKKIIEEKVTERLQFSLTQSIKTVNQKIKTVSFKDGFFAKAKINNIDFPKIEVKAESLVFDLYIKGYLQLGLEGNKEEHLVV